MTAEAEVAVTVTGTEDGCSGHAPTALLYSAVLSSISQAPPAQSSTSQVPARTQVVRAHGLLAVAGAEKRLSVWAAPDTSAAQTQHNAEHNAYLRHAPENSAHVEHNTRLRHTICAYNRMHAHNRIRAYNRMHAYNTIHAHNTIHAYNTLGCTTHTCTAVNPKTGVAVKN